MIHIYTGDGKGKTTAATGLAIRASGAGFKVLFLQLFKSGTCNESKSFSSNIDFVRCCLEKFTWEMAEEEITDYYESAISAVKNALTSNDYNLIVIDEFFMLTQLGIQSDAELRNLIVNCKAELVLTGRNAPEFYIKLADYVSEIRCIKHPFDNGVQCREGIEY